MLSYRHIRCEWGGIMLIMSSGARALPGWFIYEQSVASLLAHMDAHAIVEHHVSVIGRLSRRPRQVDIRVTGTIAGCKVVIAGECKHLSNVVGIDVVEGYLAKLEDVGADLGFLASSSGFTDPARRRAESSCCPRLLLRQFSFPEDATLTTLVDLERRYVDLYLALDNDILDDQEAFKLSRQFDAVARQLRLFGSSGANVLASARG
ncbi:restriction endonuclease [Spongiactinospora sp. 9N601]|uniref:restriction endonuclease n=1 Tax=Spongiactinospora sp. 9N601 TaxID=3375149 RepID=UPI0037961F89